MLVSSKAVDWGQILWLGPLCISFAWQSKIFFFICVATIQHLNYKRQESKMHNLQFIFLTPLWPWNKVKVIKPRMAMLIPSKVIVMQSLNNLASMKKYVNYLPIISAIIKIFHDLLDVLNKNIKFSVKTVWPWNMLKVTESGMNR